MTDVEAVLTRVLGEHECVVAEHDGVGVCICGGRFPWVNEDLFGGHDAHVAAELVAALTEAGLQVDPASALCSQCGERPSCMVKIGTTDGWCSVCLGEPDDPTEGETVTEWGVRTSEDDPDYRPFDLRVLGKRSVAERMVARSPETRRAITRQRTRYPDRVTDWQPVGGGGDDA